MVLTKEASALSRVKRAGLVVEVKESADSVKSSARRSRLPLDLLPTGSDAANG